MKVLIVINGLGTGGAEHSLLDLAPELGKRGIGLEVVCLYAREMGVGTALERHVPVTVIDSQSWPGRVREVRALIRQRRPNLVHTMIFESDIAGRLAALGTGVPVLSSVVNMSYDPIRLGDPGVKPWELGVIRILDAWTARHLTAHVHVLTDSVGKYVEERLHVSPSRITVVGRGRDPVRLGRPSDERRRLCRDLLHLSEDDQVLVTVGRQEFQKGQIFLIEAMPTVLERFPRARLLVAGRPGHASQQLLNAIDRLGLKAVVSMLGHRADIGDLLSAADLFVFPSLFEGFGGAMLEAMALRVPVLASDLPPLREVAGPGGARFVPPGLPAALAEAIVSVLDDPLSAERLGHSGLARFESRFDISTIADQMANLYSGVIEGAGRPR